MKRIWGHLIAVIGVAFGAAGMNAACAHDDSSIFVRNVILPPTPQAVKAAEQVLKETAALVESTAAALHLR